MPKEFGGVKRESTTKDGSDLGDEDEKNKLEEMKVVMLKATPSTSRSHERREGDKDIRKCYPSRPKPTTCVLDRKGVFGSKCQYRLSSAAAVQQQCNSSAADKGWRFVTAAILLGHRRAHQHTGA